METLTTTDYIKQTILDNIIDYYASFCDIHGFMAFVGIKAGHYDALKSLLTESKKEWDALPCDSDGATVEQDEAMNKHLKFVMDYVYKYFVTQ